MANEFARDRPFCTALQGGWALREAVAIHQARGDLLRQGIALRQLAIQLGKNASLAEAGAAISEAVTALEQLPPSPELARAYSTTAAVLGVGDDKAGIQWGERALELAERVGCLDAMGDTLNIVGTVELRQGNAAGAHKAATVVARRLRALGERGVRRGPRSATTANPAGLTSRETEVLDLLAAGLSNAKIAARLGLSGRTIDNHVLAIFRKLGVRTREEAAARADRLTQGDSDHQAGPD